MIDTAREAFVDEMLKAGQAIGFRGWARIPRSIPKPTATKVPTPKELLESFKRVKDIKQPPPPPQGTQPWERTIFR